MDWDKTATLLPDPFQPSNVEERLWNWSGGSCWTWVWPPAIPAHCSQSHVVTCQPEPSAERRWAGSLPSPKGLQGAAVRVHGVLFSLTKHACKKEGNSKFRMRESRHSSLLKMKHRAHRHVAVSRFLDLKAVFFLKKTHSLSNEPRRITQMNGSSPLSVFLFPVLLLRAVNLHLGTRWSSSWRLVRRSAVA